MHLNTAPIIKVDTPQQAHPKKAEMRIATMAAGKISHPYPCISSGAVSNATVTAPTPTKKITPKFTIPVYPVCKFNENAIKMKMAKLIATLETWKIFDQL